MSEHRKQSKSSSSQCSAGTYLLSVKSLVTSQPAKSFLRSPAYVGLNGSSFHLSNIHPPRLAHKTTQWSAQILAVTGRAMAHSEAAGCKIRSQFLLPSFFLFLYLSFTSPTLLTKTQPSNDHWLGLSITYILQATRTDRKYCLQCLPAECHRALRNLQFVR